MKEARAAAALLKKAQTACDSAQALIDLGDCDGACNRAYYAMFDAARAALILKIPHEAATYAKTHRGLINVFSAHMVKSGLVSVALGRLLKRAEEIRHIADYNDESVGLEDAREIVANAATFVVAIDQTFFA